MRMPPHQPAGLTRALLGCVALLGLAAGLSGCTGPGADDGDRVASSLRALPGVLSAEASVSDDPWSPGASFTVGVDPAIGDDELRELATRTMHDAEGPGWPRVDVLWTVGEGRSFSNLGGRATLDVFLGLRHGDYQEVSARGVADCGPNFCVGVDTTDPHALLAEVQHMLELADEAGGVQSNLSFTAASTLGQLTVTAEPEAPVRDAVELWAAISATTSVQVATARVVQPVGDLPPLQLLDVTVGDEAARAAAEAVGAATAGVTEKDVELTVSVAGS